MIAFQLVQMMQKKLYFRKSGTGKRALLLFHGFAQTHRTFGSELTNLEGDHTIFRFDLYYHGKSVRPAAHLSLKEWKTDLQKFLDQEHIDSFSVIAFSLGGRFALATAMLFPERLEKLILIAPDGIYRNFWFLFSTSKIGNPLFRYMMHHPARFYNLLNFFEKWRLASPSMIRFARRELSNQENCLRVYRSWTYFRRLQLSPSKVAKAVNRHDLEVHVILGEKDNIIPVKKILPRLNDIRNLKAHIFPLKHHELMQASGKLIERILNDMFVEH